MGDFVHLHVHTEYSLLDGACRIERLIDQVKALGQSAVAITDHGVMFGVIDFYKYAKKQGIKPLIGCEVYVAPRTRLDKVHKLDNSPYHLVLLCKNDKGYENLIKLVSYGFTDGFYGKPRIDRSLLEKYHDGLICLSACLAGEVPRALVNQEYSRAKETVLYFKNLFGQDNYYIELQNHGIALQQQILPDLVRLAKETGTGMVATNDAHYIEKEDSKMQQALICIQTNTTLDAPGDLEFETQEFYIKSRKEMEILFGAWPEALENTIKIADMCNLDFVFGQTKLPLFVAPNGEDNVSYFLRLCKEGLHRYYGDEPPAEVQQRLDYELGIITHMGYVDYYLIVADFIQYARSQGIPVGPGRGSGAGSLAAYCIGITGIDPIRYQLLFERFLNPERVSMPDFDIDFCYERRQEVIKYVVKKYGADHVAQIITFGTMAARGAIRDVGRVMGVSYQQVDNVAKMVPNELKMTLKKALVLSRDLKLQAENDPQIKALIDMALKLEGMPRHASTHAAGVVITREPVDYYVPLYKNEDTMAVTQFTMTTLEELGLLKMDFLGLRTLTVIDYAEKEIRKENLDFSIENVPLEDTETFAMLERGQCVGVFQFESSGMRSVIAQLRPTGIEDLIAVISLYRPGPMDSIPTYIRNRHNPELVTYAHPLLKPILEVTYGCIVYQEQVMQICRELGGYSYGRADLVRRAMSKKKHDVMEKEREAFVKGAGENGVSNEIANSIFNEMSSFASYAFNKSHAAAYAFVAYRTAYLKCHYPQAFMAALLTSVLDNTDKVIEYIAECSRMGIRVLPPDINISGSGFTVCGSEIRFSLLAIKNIGRSFIDLLVQHRKDGGSFTSFYEFCERMHGKEFNKRTLESLIKSGALDCLCSNRHSMLMGYERVLDTVETAYKNNIEGQFDLFSNPDIYTAVDVPLPDVPEFELAELLRMEKDVTGLYISGHPMQRFSQMIQERGYRLIAEVVGREGEDGLADGTLVNVVAIVTSKRVIATKSGGLMAFVRLEDTSGSVEMLVFPSTLQTCSSKLVETAVVIVSGKVSVREEDTPKLIADSILSPDEQDIHKDSPPKAQKNKGLFLRFPDETAPEIPKVLNLLSIFEGSVPLRLYYTSIKQYFSIPNQPGVQYNPTLDRELKKILGENNVIYRA